ncbi:hypothetical protein HCN52_21845, partial [Streptomyces bohaiensis]|nr:hypothetical protein [Streptomyces bohaiensis]
GRDAHDRPVDHGPLLDPLHYGRNLRSPLPEPVLGHGDYPQDPAYAAERAHLCHTLRGEGDADATVRREHRGGGLTAERPRPEPGPAADAR